MMLRSLLLALLLAVPPAAAQVPDRDQALIVNVNHVNRFGWTALIEAVILGDGGLRHTEIVRLLLAHGADAGIADRDGVTPLAHARQRGYAGIVRLLEQAGVR
jgi:ankyrin repeat protein